MEKNLPCSAYLCESSTNFDDSFCNRYSLKCVVYDEPKTSILISPHRMGLSHHLTYRYISIFSVPTLTWLKAPFSIEKPLHEGGYFDLESFFFFVEYHKNVPCATTAPG